MNSEINDSGIITRCCSFCRIAGHNITTCNSFPLTNFKSMCINYISNINISDIITDNIENVTLNNLFILCKQKFHRFLLEESLYDSHLVKSFSRRFCGANSRDNIDQCILLIVNYFSTCIYNSLYNMVINIIYRIQYTTIGQISQLHTDEQDIFGNSFYNPFIFTQIINSLNTNFRKKFKISTKINECENVESCDCNICYETFEKKNFIKLNCGHEFCKLCIKKSLENEKKDNLSCAFCRAEINEFELYNHEIREEFNDLIL